MSLSCSWCDRPRMRPGSAAAAAIQLGESAWCDVMHVLHSFVRPRSIEDLHSQLHSDAVTRRSRRPRSLASATTAVKLVSVGWIGPRIAFGNSSAANLRVSLPESLLSLGLAQLQRQLHRTPLRAPLLLSFWAPSASMCRNWLPPVPPETGWLSGSSCVLSLIPRICTNSQGRPCTPIACRNLTSDF